MSAAPAQRHSYGTPDRPLRACQKTTFQALPEASAFKSSHCCCFAQRRLLPSHGRPLQIPSPSLKIGKDSRSTPFRFRVTKGTNKVCRAYVDHLNRVTWHTERLCVRPIAPGYSRLWQPQLVPTAAGVASHEGACESGGKVVLALAQRRHTGRACGPRNVSTRLRSGETATSLGRAPPITLFVIEDRRGRRRR